MGAGEPGMGPDEIEPAGGELVDAVLREFTDETVLVRHDAFPCERDRAGLEAPERSLLGEMSDFRGIEQRFSRHAAAEDAEPAHFLAPFEHGGAQAGGGAGARGGITAAASAQ